MIRPYQNIHFSHLTSCASCKPINSSSNKPLIKISKKKEKIDNVTSNLPDRTMDQSWFTQEIPEAGGYQFFHIICRDDSRLDCDDGTDSVEPNGIAEIRSMYRITYRLNKTTSASYYQTIYRYTSANGKALILKYYSNARYTQNQTITSKERDMEGYVYNIRIENISDSTINLRFVEGQEIVDDPALGGYFTVN